MLHQSDAKLKPIVTLATCVFTRLRPVACLKFECSLHGPCDFDLLLLHCIGVLTLNRKALSWRQTPAFNDFLRVLQTVVFSAAGDSSGFRHGAVQ